MPTFRKARPNQKGVGVLGVTMFTCLLVLAMLGAYSNLSITSRSIQSFQDADEARGLQDLLMASIDCVGTFQKNNITPVSVTGSCSSTSAMNDQKPPYLNLKRKATTVTAVSYVPEVIGKYRVRASCSKSEGSLIVRLAKADAPQPNYYTKNTLIIGGTQGPGSIFRDWFNSVEDKWEKKSWVLPLCGADFPGVIPVTGIEAGGSFFTCSVQAGGAKCWGEATQGGSGIAGSWANPMQVQGLTSGVTFLNAGGHHTCAIVNGGAKCWGVTVNDQGELGNGVMNGGSYSPVDVVGLSSDVTHLDAGLVHTCAVVNGAVKCWGNNDNGQLGNNSRVASAVPVDVVGLTAGATEVYVTNTTSCALVSGRVKCWGQRLGIFPPDAGTDALVPYDMPGLPASGVIGLGGADRIVCANVGGAVKCWGQNAGDSMCLGYAGHETAPVDIPTLDSNVTEISRNEFASDICVIQSGVAKCCGQYTWLGYTSPHTMQVVPGLPSGVSHLTHGHQHYCALVNNAAMCWGTNNRGQLGDGTTTNRTLPGYVIY